MKKTASMLALSLLMACGKEDPKPATPSAPAPAPTNAPTAAPETKPEPVDPMKPVVKDAPPPVKPVTPAVMSPVPEQTPLVSTTLATIPADIVAVGGIQSPRGLMDAFLAQTKRVPGLTQTADPLDFLMRRVKEAFGAKDLGWLALDKPVRFAIPNPKKNPDGFIQIYSLVPGTKLEPTIFANAKAKDEGHWASLPAGDRKVYLDLEGELLVITSHPALAKEQAALIKDLAAWTPPSPLVVEASATNARAAFAEEIVGLQGDIDTFGKQLAEAGFKPEQLQMLKTFTDGAFGILTGLDRLGLAVDAAGNFPRLAFSFRAIPGTPFAAATADLQKRRPTLASLVPQDAWLTLLYDADLSGLMGGDGILASLASQSDAKWSPDDIKAFKAFVDKVKELTLGNSAFWITKSGNFPLAIESVSSSKDGLAQRDAMLGILNLVFEKQWGATREMLIKNGGPADKLPGVDFKSFITAAGQLGRVFGVTPSLPKIEGADTLAFDFDWSRLGQGKIPPALRDALVNMLGNRLELAVAASPSRFVAAIGPYAANRAIELGALSSDAAPQDAWLASAAKDNFALLSLRPTRLARSLLDLPQMARGRDIVLALPDDPVMITAASDGAAVNVTVTLPVELLVTFFAAF